MSSATLSESQNSTNQSDVFAALALTAFLLLGNVVVQSVGGLARRAQGLKVGERLDREMHDRAVKVDLLYFESPQYHDSLQRAREAGVKRPAQVVESILLLIKSATFLVALLAMMWGIDWRLLPGVLVGVLAILYVSLKFTRRLNLWQRQQAQTARRAAYFDWLITSDQHAKELRLGGLGNFLREEYAKLRSLLNAQDLEIHRRRMFSELVAMSLGAFIFAGATVYMVLEVMEGRQTIGVLVLFVLLFRRAEMSGRELVTHAAKLVDDQMYLGQVFKFLEIEPLLTVPEKPVALPEYRTRGIEFHDVSFTYPNGREPALRNVTLCIPPKKIVALVGANGSGKTTLIKLLARLYDPNTGTISLEGTDIRSFDPESYRRHFSIVFQDFSKYAASVRDNIRYGDITNPADLESVKQAARKGGALELIERLPSGFDTPLTRLFDGGEELSIGQWQRLALARAFFPPSDCIIMDEPSSALDPEAERLLFENFREVIGDRSALIISHRLSTVRLADYTYVLDAGEIVEQGRHEELLAKNGHYADLFEKQGRGYRRNEA